MRRELLSALVVRGRSAVVGACALLAACGGGEAQWRLPSSDAELEAAALRGDSMAAEIATGRAIADTLARIAAGELDPSLIATLGKSADAPLPAAVPVPSAEPSFAGTGATMTARAIARADSLVRDEAQRSIAASQRASGTTARGVVASRRADGDTVRGVLTLDGAPPAVRVTLVTPSAAMPLGLSGMAVSELLRLDGLEAEVRGVRVGPRDLAVTSFTVQAIDGIPVADGVLENQGGVWSVRLADGGRQSLAQVPTPLQAFVGARVWVALKPGASPSYGVITRR